MKLEALKMHDKNLNKIISLSKEVLDKLVWWDSQILIAKNKIRFTLFDFKIFSDASGKGWGATCGELKANGLWNSSGSRMPIDYLELKAAFLALKCFAATKFGK